MIEKSGFVNEKHKTTENQSEKPQKDNKKPQLNMWISLTILK